jgi:hypothetical protein
VSRFRFVGVPTPDGDAVEARTAAPSNGGDATDPYLILAVRRNDAWEPMHERFELRQGDEGAIAVFDAEAGQANERLAELGWQEISDGEDPGGEPGGIETA